MPIGASIIALADTEQTAEALLTYEDVVEGARHQWGRAETRGRADKRRPMGERARGEPRQLLGIMQADWLMAESGRASKSFAGSETMRITLDRAGGYAAGATGLSIDSYVRLADELVRDPEVDVSQQTWIDRNIAALYAARSENLDSAQKDTFHWRMLPRPAELVDLDATILMVLALGTNLASKLLESSLEREPSILYAPLYIAQALRSDYEFKHRL